MKMIAKKYILAIFCIAVLTMGCKEEEVAPTETEVQLEKLNGTWKAIGVTKDGVPQADYGNFTITLLGDAVATTYNYSTGGRPAKSPWKSGGTWVFGSQITSDMIRDKGTVDELPMTYTVTDTQLIIDLEFDGLGYSNTRVSSVGGNWKFTMSR